MGEVRLQANPIRDRSAAAVIEAFFSTFADFEAQRLELRALGFERRRRFDAQLLRFGPFRIPGREISVIRQRTSEPLYPSGKSVQALTESSIT
jgi:hypothetical protein